MEILKHKVWEFETLEEYKKNILEDVFIKNEVPESIKIDLQLIEKIMLYTFYEYDFIDVALVQSIFTLERALKTKYKELGQTDTMNLEKLINWFFKNNYFETDSVSEIHSLRDVRNKKAHDIERHDKGLLYIKPVFTIFDLINDLYEDKDLRVERKKTLLEIQGNLNEICKEGLIFEIKGKKYIGFQSLALFYNNKADVNELTLNVWLIYKPGTLSYNYGIASNSIEITIINWEFKDNELVATLKEDGSVFSATPLIEAKNIDQFKNWKKEIKGEPNWELNWFSLTDSIKQTKILREFHRS
ncbi:MAG: DUF4145 domain-containing protein [Bacteroidia bacterium]|nr:DUF4145 domain-containing protein [Bacteroidia bacterium]